MKQEQGTVRGIVFTKLKPWFERNYSLQQYQAVLAALPEDSRELLQAPTLSSISKLPSKVFTDMINGICGVLAPEGGKGEELIGSYAAFMAEQDLNASMKIFMKLGSPHFTAKRFSSVYSHYFGDGILEVELAKPHFAQCVLKEHEVLGEGICWGSYGWSKMALIYAGAKNLVSEHSECAFRGGKVCIYTFKWD